MTMRRYALVLECWDLGKLGDSATEELREELESAAAGVLCDLRGGDSGPVGLEFAEGERPWESVAPS